MKFSLFLKLSICIAISFTFNPAQAGLKELIVSPGSKSNYKYSCNQESAELAYSKIPLMTLGFNSNSKRIVSTLTLSLPDNSNIISNPNLEPRTFLLGPFVAQPLRESSIEKQWAEYSELIPRMAKTIISIFSNPSKVPYEESNITQKPPKFKPNSYVYHFENDLEVDENNEPIGIINEILQGGTLSYDIHIVTPKNSIDEGEQSISVQVYLSFSRLEASAEKGSSFKTHNVFEMKCIRNEDSNQEAAAAVATLSSKNKNKSNSSDNNNNFESTDDIEFLNPVLITNFITYWAILSNIEKSELLNKTVEKIEAMDRKKMATVGAAMLAGVWASVKMASKKIPLIGLAAFATSAQAVPESCISPDLISNIMGLSSEELNTCLDNSPNLKRELRVLINEAQIK